MSFRVKLREKFDKILLKFAEDYGIFEESFGKSFENFENKNS